MCGVKDMAIYVVKTCQDENTPINNLTLQRVLQKIQREYSDSDSAPHFEGEPLVFRFGPVYPDAYRLFSSYSDRPITREVHDGLGSRLGDDDKTRIRNIISQIVSVSTRGRKKSPSPKPQFPVMDTSIVARAAITD